MVSASSDPWGYLEERRVAGGDAHGLAQDPLLEAFEELLLLYGAALVLVEQQLLAPRNQRRGPAKHTSG